VARGQGTPTTMDESATATPTRRLSAIDIALLVTLTPIFLICLVLHTQMAFSGGSSATPFILDFDPGPRGTPFIAAGTTDRRALDSGLEVGDRLLSIGDTDLHGISPFGVQLAWAAAIRNGETRVVLVDRGGQLVEGTASIAPGKIPWSSLPMVIGFAAVALLVLLRGPRTDSSRIFFAAFMSIAIFQSFISTGSSLQMLASFFIFPLFGFIGLTMTLLWVISFPRPPASEDLQFRFPNWIALVIPTLWVLPRLNYGLQGPLPRESYTTQIYTIDILFFLTIIGVASWNYYCVNAADRRRIRWVLFGLYVAFIPSILINIIGTTSSDYVWINWLHGLSRLGLVAIPISMWIAITRFGFYDVDRVLSGTVTYTALVVLLALAAEALLEPFAADVALSIGANPGNMQLAFVGFVAAVSIPIQRVCAPHVDRILFSRTQSLNEALQDLVEEIAENLGDTMVELAQLVGEQLTELLRPEVCMIHLRDTSELAWRPAYVATGSDAPQIVGDAAEAIAALLDNRVGPLWLTVGHSGGGRQPSKLHADVDHFQALIEAGVQLVIPFNRHGHCVGFLSLGGKQSRDVYTNTDLSLLTAIAMQASLSASAPS
jgi:hypothetical protein